MKNQLGTLKSHKNWPRTMKNHGNWPGTLKYHPWTLNNHKNPPGTIKNRPGTLKNHKTWPRTMKNHKNRPRTMKNQPGWLQETPRRKWWFFVTDRQTLHHNTYIINVIVFRRKSWRRWEVAWFLWAKTRVVEQLGWASTLSWDTAAINYKDIIVIKKQSNRSFGLILENVKSVTISIVKHFILTWGIRFRKISIV